MMTTKEQIKKGLSESEVYEIKRSLAPTDDEIERKIMHAKSRNATSVDTISKPEFRVLQEGEEIMSSDYSLCDITNKWKQVKPHMVGKRCSSPLYSSHSIYKRITRQ